MPELTRLKRYSWSGLMSQGRLANNDDDNKQKKRFALGVLPEAASTVPGKILVESRFYHLIYALGQLPVLLYRHIMLKP